MQAIILAAGMGKRLKDLTKDSAKCMLEVNGITLIERMLKQLDKINLSQIVIVVGYKSELVKEYIDSLNKEDCLLKTPIVYVDNPIYYKTNNIYSLFLAKKYLLEEDTILLESDIIFEDIALKQLIENEYENLALVSKYESWMDGTVVCIDDECNILHFIDKKHFEYEKIKTYYKTVNIYKFSKAFSQTRYVPFLEAYSKALGDNEYYEQVLRVITLLDNPGIKALVLDKTCNWYEIDDVQDLDIAESIFDTDLENKFNKIQSRYGGFWRYPQMLDFCYLVNPYFPPKKLLEEIQANFSILISQYPSGLGVNNLLAAKNFGLRNNQIIIGNGAAELINSLMNDLEGNIGIIFPSFEEYANRVDKDRIVSFVPNFLDFRYTVDQLIEFYANHKVDNLLLINPDNPSGNFIKKDDVVKLIDWTKLNNINLIIDESFVDFAEEDISYTLFDSDILDNNKHLTVVKSISKSYGVPGLRLGVLASSNQQNLENIKKNLSIWNINSFGEYYMQIAEKYNKSYLLGLSLFRKERERFINELQKIDKIKTLSTQANYIMCELENISSFTLSVTLLNEYNILIKDLSKKLGINNRNFIRIAVRNTEENNMLLKALKKELG